MKKLLQRAAAGGKRYSDCLEWAFEADLK